MNKITIITQPDPNYKQLQINQQEIDTLITPVLEALKAKKLDPVGIAKFKNSALMGCKNFQIAIDNYQTGLLKDRTIMLSSIDDAITRLITYRVMLERPEEDIYEECTSIASSTVHPRQ